MSTHLDAAFPTLPAADLDTATTDTEEKRVPTWVNMIPFMVIHLIAFGAIWTGVSTETLIVCAVVYTIQMLGVTAGYHRYFAHRTFKTSRAFQFVLACLAQTSAQRGSLWWASKHRHHHKYSDQPEDIHSPVQRGFWHSHVGWIFDSRHWDTDLSKIRDMAKYPELRFLDQWHLLPAIALGVTVTAIWGAQGLIVGFFWPLIASWHATFTINSVSHVWGTRRYATTDDSRNNALFAIVTLGEGWHNNHHHYMTSAKQGFRWWEIDLTYYVLRFLSFFRIISDLRMPPKDKVNETIKASASAS